METEIEPWLPMGALNAQRSRQAFAETMAGWAGRYFTHDRVDLVLDETRVLRVDREAFSVEGTKARISISETGSHVLLAAILGVSVNEDSMTGADHMLLARIAKAVIDDLAKRLDALVSDVSGGAPDVSFTLLIAGNPTGKAHVPRRALLALVKRQLVPSHNNRKRPSRRSLASAGTRVALHARLGCAVLTIDDVKGIGPGDVLVLDRPVSDGVDLCTDRSVHGIARGAFSTAEGRNLLTVTAPNHGQ